MYAESNELESARTVFATATTDPLVLATALTYFVLLLVDQHYFTKYYSNKYLKGKIT